MKLEVNGEEILFELENEKNLLDFMGGVTEHLRDRGFVDLQIEVDGEKISCNNNLWHERAIESVECVKVSGQSVYDFAQCIHILESGKNLFDQIQIDLIKVREFFSLWPCLILSLKFWLVDFHLGDNYFVMLASIPGLVEKNDDKSVFQPHVVKLFELSIRAMHEKGRELDQPHQEIFLVLERLREFQDSLMELSVLFQSGKDYVAMQSILKFVELFSKFIRTVNFLPQNYEFFREQTSQIVKDLSMHIRDFTHACETKDYISAADLAEYEIVPQLIKLDRFKDLLVK